MSTAGSRPAPAATGASASTTPAAERWKTWLFGIGFVVLGTVLPLLRQQGVPVWRTIWAEDGQIYVQEALDHGSLAVLFRGYGGYLQLPTRLLAIPAGWLSAAQLPVYLAVASAFVAALLGLAVYRFTDGWISSRPIRLVVATIVVLGPTLGSENLPGITNLLWTFLAALPWALVSLAERPRDVAFRGVVAFFGATATSVSVLFFPLAIGFAVYRRTKASFIVAGTYLFGLAVQAAVVLTTQDAARPAPQNSLRQLYDQLGVRVLAEFLVGNRPVQDLWEWGGSRFVTICVVVVAAIFVTLLIGASRRSQGLAVVFLAYAAIAYAVPAWGRGTALVALDHAIYTEGFMRYAVVSVFLLVSAFAVLCDPTGPERTRLIARVARIVLIVQVIVVVATSFTVTASTLGGARGGGPDVVDEVDVLRGQCAGAPPDQTVVLAISPLGWGVVVHCDMVD